MTPTNAANDTVPAAPESTRRPVLVPDAQHAARAAVEARLAAEVAERAYQGAKYVPGRSMAEVAKLARVDLMAAAADQASPLFGCGFRMQSGSDRAVYVRVTLVLPEGTLIANLRRARMEATGEPMDPGAPRHNQRARDIEAAAVAILKAYGKSSGYTSGSEDFTITVRFPEGQLAREMAEIREQVLRERDEAV